MIQVCLICGDAVECPDGSTPLCGKDKCVERYRKRRIAQRENSRVDQDGVDADFHGEGKQESAVLPDMARRGGTLEQPTVISLAPTVAANLNAYTPQELSGSTLKPPSSELTDEEKQASYLRQLEKLGPKCKKHPDRFERTCQLCKSISQHETAVPKPSKSVVTENSVRSALGMPRKTERSSAPWYTTPEEQERHTLLAQPEPQKSNGKPSFRDVLGLTQDILLSWLELKPVLYGVPGIPTIVKDRDRQRIASDYDDAPVIEHQNKIQELEAELKELESQLADARNPNRDSGLSPQKLRWVKLGLEKTIKETKNEIGGMKRRKIEPRRRSLEECWVSVEVPGTEREVVKYPDVRSITDDDVRHYQGVVNLVRQQKEKERIDFENKVIINAIKGWIFAPLKSVKGYSDLTCAIPMYNRPNVNISGLDPTSDDGSYEASLIIKTGGDQIGGSIISGGFNGGRQRALSSFEGSQIGITRHSGDGDSEDNGCPDYDVSDDSIE